jgi:hypothetical protein
LPQPSHAPPLGCSQPRFHTLASPSEPPTKHKQSKKIQKSVGLEPRGWIDGRCVPLRLRPSRLGRLLSFASTSPRRRVASASSQLALQPGAQAGTKVGKGEGKWKIWGNPRPIQHPPTTCDRPPSSVKWESGDARASEMTAHPTLPQRPAQFRVDLECQRLHTPAMCSGSPPARIRKLHLNAPRWSVIVDRITDNGTDNGTDNASLSSGGRINAPDKARFRLRLSPDTSVGIRFSRADSACTWLRSGSDLDFGSTSSTASPVWSGSDAH